MPHASLTPAGEERCAADFIALLGMLAEAFPRAPVIVVICDNDSIHHVRKVTAYLKEHLRLELVYGARYSPHDNPAERIWAALKNYVANTAVSWPGRLQQIHAFFRSRSPDKMLATAAPWTSPWLPPVTSRTFGMLLSSLLSAMCRIWGRQRSFLLNQTRPGGRPEGDKGVAGWIARISRARLG